MSIVNTLSLESNRKIKINFNGGDLSSDAGLLFIKEFVSKLGIDKLFSQSFKTNEFAIFNEFSFVNIVFLYLKVSDTATFNESKFILSVLVFNIVYIS